MDSLLIMIILGVIAIGGSLIGGFRLAKVQTRLMKKIRLVGTMLLLLAVGVYLFSELRDSASIQNGIQSLQPSATTSAVRSVRTEGLELNQTTSYQLNLDEELALTYDGELGQVVTLTIIPEIGTAPTIYLSSQVGDNPPIADGSIRARGQQTIVCGYQFDVNGTLTFLFQATENTSYRVEFVEGNSCQSD